eukprot:390956-Rhodomonas_salina.2
MPVFSQQHASRTTVSTRSLTRTHTPSHAVTASITDHSTALHVTSFFSFSSLLIHVASPPLLDHDMPLHYWRPCAAPGPPYLPFSVCIGPETQLSSLHHESAVSALASQGRHTPDQTPVSARASKV